MTPPAGLPVGWSIAIALIVLAVGSSGISVLLTVRSLNRKTLSEAKKNNEDAELADANSRKAVVESTLLLLEPLSRQAKSLDEQLTAAQAEVRELRNQVAQMAKEMTVLQEENARLRGDAP